MFARAASSILCLSGWRDGASASANRQSNLMHSLSQRLKGAVVYDDAHGGEQDRQIAPDRPAGEIFQIGLQPVGQVTPIVGGAAQAAHLGQAGETGLASVPVPVARID